MVLKIEFLYFNKTACSRCKTTNENIKKSLNELKAVLKESDVRFELVEKRLSKNQLKKSPTILIDKKDVEKLVNKNNETEVSACSSCSGLTNKKSDCRSYFYKNKRYDFIPKNMIKEAIKNSFPEELKWY